MGGGKLTEISEQTMAELNEFLPSAWSHNNPIDILGDASPELYAKTLAVAAKDKNADGLLVILTPQAGQPEAFVGSPQPALRIGIVAGHNASDSGAVCADENGNVTLTEADVNKKIADLARAKLIQRGYQVDLLNEFDTRLSGYNAVALVSIHNDSCEYINDEATGFKVASSAQTVDRNRAQRLTACLVDRYAAITGLNFHAGSITADMREYHAFSEINPNTVTAIIETGFLYLDREILTQETERIAEGVVQGILCYINNESVEPTPMPTVAP
jgi:N-acetylmuramoyl-L-alanine amidase